MKKLFLILLLFNLKVFSQEVVFTDSKLGEKLPIDESNLEFDIIDDTLILNFINEQVIKTYTNNLEFSSPKIQRITKTSFGYTNFVGSYGNLSDRVFVYTRNSNKKFLTLKHSFSTDTSKETKLEFKLKNQAYLGHISYKNNFYVISAFKNSRIIRLTKIDLDSNFTEIDINIENGAFYTDGILQESMPSNRTASKTSDLIFNFGPDFKTSIIKNNVPNSNVNVTKPNKIYVDGDKLFLTLDSNFQATVVITIDLNDYTPTTQYISNKIYIEKGVNEAIKSNSFLLDGVLYQTKGTKKEVAVVSYNLADGKRKEIITFNKDSPYEEERNLLISEEIREKYNISPSDKTKEENIGKRLKKIMKSANDVGFQITKNDNVLLFTLGAYLQTTSSSPGALGFGGAGFGGAGFGPTVGFSITFTRDLSLNFFVGIKDNSLSYSDFESPYIRMNQYLDKQYEKRANRKTKWTQKFNIGNDYFLGYLDKKTKEYRFVKFN